MSPVMVAPLAALATLLLVCAPGGRNDRASRPGLATPLQMIVARAGTELLELIDVVARRGGAR